ncbi:MAG: homogentisate 1,2-dioxygenase [Alphaproteobacteria bacterium]|nr:homogentisate 1,2-dioxygenase [Alphaproteobacteria bacterium]
MRRFDHPGPPRVLFGPGAEALTAEALAELGAERVLLVAQARHREGAERLAEALGPRCVGIFDQVAPQVPEEVAEAARAMARAREADWVLAHGGGSAIGVAKAVTLALDVQLAAIPTTYSGSEMTPIWGITAGGVKTTGRDPRVQPALVVYDPELLQGLSPVVTRTSLFNALAHSAEALYAHDASEAVREAAEAGARSLFASLQALVDAPAQGPLPLELVAEGLHGAHLAGEVLGKAAMGLHHKLAHVLGGSFGTPHADTHTALLPHSLAANLPHAPEALARLQRAFGVADPVAALWDLAAQLGAPTRLEGFGLAQVEAAVELAMQKQYPNPAPLSPALLGPLLADLALGRRPSLSRRRLRLEGAEGPHATPLAALLGAPLEEAELAVLVVHGRGQSAEDLSRRLMAQAPGGRIAWLAPQAAARTWYPKGFQAEAENAAWQQSAYSALDAAWARLRQQLPPERVLVVGWSQGACLALSWLSQAKEAPRHLHAFTGAANPGARIFRDLDGVEVFVGTIAEDPWVPLAEVEATRDALRAAGAQVSCAVEAGDTHAIRPSELSVFHHRLERMMSSDFPTQTGYGNHLRSEALPGALPQHQNAPHAVPYGLYAEQINGTGFTVERAHNQRVWLYRLRPQVLPTPWERADAGGWTSDFSAGVTSPELLRFRRLPYPEGEVDFVRSLRTFAGAGSPQLKRGLSIHLYTATADMVDRAFANHDGDLAVVPQEGALRVRTELGWLRAEPGQLLILPRGIRFAVHLEDGRARGWVSELFDGHYQLPERGPVGANGLADERHFHAPVASFEDREAPHEILVRQGGALWRNVSPHSPFDVVAWHGRYAPFVYDLADFVAMWSVTVDHSDPSILTVLTHPLDTHGRNAVDIAVFKGRWDPTEHSFRPPFLHRNSAVEFNAVVKSPATAGPYQAGAYSYTPYLSPHSISAKGVARELARADDSPRRSSDDELWVQWESTYQLQVMPDFLGEPSRDRSYLEQFRGFPPHKAPTQG